MSDKEIVANKVERYLKEIFPAAQKKAEGQFSVAFESTRIWIYIEDGQVPKLEKTKAPSLVGEKRTTTIKQESDDE